MISTYMRSSSYGAWDFCQHRYFLEYVLGIKGRSPNNKAEKGSVVHKAFELLAHRKLCEQEGRTTFTDTELKMDFRVDEVTPDVALRAAYSHYSDPTNSIFDWKPLDLKHCTKWMHDTLNFNNGMFDPRNRKVVTPEKFFDLVIDEPWAKISAINPHDGSKIEGQLAIKGTIDLVTEVTPDTLEYLDWKTGRRFDWAKDQVKSYKKLCRDFQLLLYFYALQRLYPEYKHVFVSIFFCQDGGPYSICFEKDLHKKVFLEMLRRRFEAIQNTHRPKLIITDASKRWKCSKLCSFGKDIQPGTNITVCEHMRREVVSLGLDRVVQKYGKKDAFLYYGDGGGASNREGPAQ